MKFLFLIVFLCLSLGIVAFLAKPKLSSFPSASANPSPPPLSTTYTIDAYTLFVQPINPGDPLKLIPNFLEKNTAARIFEQNNCAYGINGGFYTPEQKPLGYFFTEGKTYASAIHGSSLLSGFVFYTPTDGIKITPFLNQAGAFSFAFQAGPFFLSTDRPTFTPDEPDRRMLLAQSDQNAYFIAVVQTDNVYSGPHLSELPELVQKVPLSITQAINLDGGSASAFFSESGVRLEEITPIGSFLCGK